MSQAPALAFSQIGLNAGKVGQVTGQNRVIHVAANFLGESVVRVKDDVGNAQPFQFLKKEPEKVAGAKPHG